MDEETKCRIGRAVHDLLSDRSLSGLTVADICRAAGISRPTFYYHFRDKADVVGWIYARLADDSNPFSAASAASLMEQMKSDTFREFFRRAYDDVSQNALWEYLLEFYTSLYEREACRILHTTELDPALRFSIRMYCYGCVGVCCEWFRGPDTVPASAVVEGMFRAMPEDMRQLFGMENGPQT